MQAMLTAMSEINMASEDIAKIIKVIDDIAFQTNIWRSTPPCRRRARASTARLRGGGRGGALPRRALAQAAKQTTDSIGQSIKEVEKGARIADATATCSAPS